MTDYMAEFVIRTSDDLPDVDLAQLIHTECNGPIVAVQHGTSLASLVDLAASHECEATRQTRARRLDRRFRTANGVLITDGLRVWDYDRKPGTVDLVRSRVDDQYWDGWFDVRSDRGGYSTMNGERLTTVDPFTGESPPPAPIQPGDDKS
jgi:hypothetical protein